jgi:hemolysin activation/secretion protein
MAYLMEKLDNNINPFRGFRLQWSFSAGGKEVGDHESYLHSEGELIVTAHVPVTGPFGIKIKNQTAWMWSEELHENELFRLGGLKTLRGQDENSLYASGYSIFNMEPRLVLPGESTAFLFYDIAYHERPTQEYYLVDWPKGFGAGINLKTNSGIFSFVYALGQRLGNPVEMKSAKIHLGYVNRF